MRKLVTLLVLLSLAGFTGFILARNKKIMSSQADRKSGAARIPVTVVPVTYRDLSEDQTVTGVFAPHQEIKLLAESPGKVVYAGVAEGDYVTPGTVIARLDDELIRAELVAAEAAYEQAGINVKRFEALRKGDATTDAQVEDTRLAHKNARARLLTLRKQLRNTAITAPIAGTITARSFGKGSVVLPGQPLAEITDITRLKLVINVPEADVFNYRAGAALGIRTDVYPGVTLPGVVKVVGVKADASRNYPVQIMVENTARHPLKAGMYGRASSRTSVRDSVLTVPRTALVGSVKAPRLYVVQGDRAELRNIRVGASAGQYIEVLDGAAAGERVVTSGQINLKPGAPVQAVGNR